MRRVPPVALVTSIAALLLFAPARAGIPDPEPTPGRRVGADFQFNTTLPGAQRRPAAAASPDGGMITVWDDDSSVRGRRFDRSGTPLDDDFEVAASGRKASVAWTETGFVVVSENAGEIRSDRFDAAGNPLASAVLVNAYTTGGQSDPDLARLADGTFVVVWMSQGAPHDSDSYSIRGRALDADGIPVGDEVGINTYTTGAQTLPRVAASKDGGFLVVWQNPNEVRSRRFETLDGVSGADLMVADSAPVNPHPAAAASADGGYWAAWSDVAGGASILLRRLDATGNPFGDEENLGAAPASAFPSLVAGRLGDGFAVWHGIGSDSIVGRRLSADGAPVGDDFKVDQLGAWSERGGAAVEADERGGFVALWHDYDCCAGPGVTPVGDVWMKRYPAAEGDPADGLVAYWPFDEGSGTVAADAFGEVADDGQVQGAIWNSGRFGQALYLEANDVPADWVFLPPSSDLEVTGDEVSIATWLKLRDFPSAFPEIRASVFDGFVDNYVLYLDRDDASIRFAVTNASATTASARIPEERLELRRWHHVAGVYDGGAGEVRVYLDGALVETAPLTGSVRSSSPQNSAIGRNGSEDNDDNGRYYFRGWIDDMAIWNRALSATEIDALAHHRIFADGFEIGGDGIWSTASD